MLHVASVCTSTQKDLLTKLSQWSIKKLDTLNLVISGYFKALYPIQRIQGHHPLPPTPTPLPDNFKAEFGMINLNQNQIVGVHNAGVRAEEAKPGRNSVL